MHLKIIIDGVVREDGEYGAVSADSLIDAAKMDRADGKQVEIYIDGKKVDDGVN